MLTFGRPAADEYHPYYSTYVDLVPEADLEAVLLEGLADLCASLEGLDEDAALGRYRPEAWSVKQVLGHVSDGERLFGMRALCLSRGEPQPLPGFDENSYVEAAGFDRRSLAELVEEQRHLRLANLAMLRGWTPEMALRRGVASGRTFSARALAWILAGHERHHLAVLHERYGVPTP